MLEEYTENGVKKTRPKVFYHGAKKSGGFTTFRKWQYFTENLSYANRYAERGNEKALYSVYLRAGKIFDTRDANARKIFEDIRSEYGLGELQDTGLPDWTDGYDITDYLDNHPELGYDAILLDEGGDLVDGEPVSRGESIVVKEPAQVKSATDNIGTYDGADPDIRFERVGKDTEIATDEVSRNKIFAENFQKRLDAWDGKTDGFAFVMGESRSYLANLEVLGKKIGKKQVRIDATKIKKIMRDHPEMEIGVFKNLPHLLNDPILVLDSKSVEGRLVLLGEVYAKNKPVIMALEINPTARSGKSTYADIIKVAGSYARSNTQNVINTSKIRYVNQNESRVSDWLKVNRLQLPLPNSQSYSATDSIPDSSEKVNTLSENSSRKFLDGETRFERIGAGAGGEVQKRTAGGRRLGRMSMDAARKMRNAARQERSRGRSARS